MAFDFTNNITGGGRGQSRDMAGYEQRLKYMQDLRKAQELAYAPGEATPEEIAALGIDPAIWQKAQQEDLQTSARKQAGNFSSNMLPLAFLTAAVGGNALLGAGGGATGAATGAGASSGALGSGAMNWLPFLEPGAAAAPAFDFGTALSSAGAGAGSAGALGTVGGGALPEVGALPQLSAAELGGGTGGGGIVDWGDAAKLAGGASDAAGSGTGIMDLLSNGKNIASVLGALAGGSSTGSSKSEQREPWGPAQGFIKDQIANGQTLSDYYKQNPFNQQQKAGIQNTLTDADQFRNQVLPGLMQFANGAMGGQYQRQKGGAPGSGGGYGGGIIPGGYSPGQGNTFAMAPGQNFGILDFASMNPFKRS